MTSLASEIKSLMELGHSLERATELAVGDRKQSSSEQQLAGNH